MERRICLPDYYEILSFAGQSEHFETWKCKDLRTESFVAVKVLRPLYWLNEDESAYRRENVIRSITRLQDLDIRGVTRITEIGETSNLLYFIRPWIEGITLADHIRMFGPMPLRQVEYALTSIGAALEALHNEGIQWNSIPLEKIICHPHNVCYLTDIGLAKSAGEFKINGISCRYAHTGFEETLRSLAAIAVEALTGSPVTPGNVKDAHLSYLPPYARYALKQTLYSRKPAYPSIEDFLCAMYPRSNMHLFRLVWRPAAAVGIMSALITAGGYAYSSRRQSNIPAAMQVRKDPFAGLSVDDQEIIKLAIRRQGVAALSHPAIASVFHLSQSQYNQVQEALSEQRENTVAMVENAALGQNDDIAARMKTMREETDARVLLILNDDQRGLWNSLSNSAPAEQVPAL
jgi:serine/threonine protein kinase